MTCDDAEEDLRVRRFVTITGARSIEDAAGLAGAFDDYLRPFASTGAHFYLGGATGVDTLALRWLAERSSAALSVVVPCTAADQPSDAAEAIAALSRQSRLDKLVELAAPHLGSAAYQARNRWMVDRSSLVIGFPTANSPSSGTWYTLGYAADQGKPRLIVPVG